MKMKCEDFIGMSDNSIDEKLCWQLVKWFEWASEHRYTLSSKEESGMHSVLRKDESIRIPHDLNYSSAVAYQFPTEICQEYFDSLQKCYEEYQQEYGTRFDGSLQNYNFKIHKVKKGQGYHSWHYENSSYDLRDRFLTYMTYLKSPEEGGDTEFLHQSKKIEPIERRTLIWPVGFTHVHRGNPPLKGEIIYITGWFHLGQSK